MDSKPVSTIKSKRQFTMALLKPLYGIAIRNKETGISATFASTGARKMVSGKAISKSIKNGFTEDDHLNAVQRIKELFENAYLSKIHADKNSAENIIQIKRFVANVGNNVEALITVKESKQAGHKIYSLELEEIKKASSIYDEQLPKGTTCVENASSTPTIDEPSKKVNGSTTGEKNNAGKKGTEAPKEEKTDTLPIEYTDYEKALNRIVDDYMGGKLDLEEALDKVADEASVFCNSSERVLFIQNGKVCPRIPGIFIKRKGKI